MTLATLAARAGEIKAVVTTIVVTVGVLVGILGIAKLPGKIDRLSADMNVNRVQTDITNKKLDVLICLQAKLDTPLRCVAQNK